VFEGGSKDVARSIIGRFEGKKLMQPDMRVNKVTETVSNGERKGFVREKNKKTVKGLRTEKNELWGNGGERVVAQNA